MQRQLRCNIGPLQDLTGPCQQSQLCEPGCGTGEGDCPGFYWSRKVQDRVKNMVIEGYEVGI